MTCSFIFLKRLRNYFSMVSTHRTPAAKSYIGTSHQNIGPYSKPNCSISGEVIGFPRGTGIIGNVTRLRYMFTITVKTYPFQQILPTLLPERSALSFNDPTSPRFHLQSPLNSMRYKHCLHHRTRPQLCLYLLRCSPIRHPFDDNIHKRLLVPVYAFSPWPSLLESVVSKAKPFPPSIKNMPDQSNETSPQTTVSGRNRVIVLYLHNPFKVILVSSKWFGPRNLSLDSVNLLTPPPMLFHLVNCHSANGRSMRPCIRMHLTINPLSNCLQAFPVR